MICPYCASTFALTWRRYLSEPFGRHSCPACGKRSKLGTGPVYWLLYVPLAASLPLIAILVGLVAFALLAPEHSEQRLMSYFDGWLWALPAAAAFFLVFPIDRYVDERLRKLRPLEGTSK